MLLDRPKQSLHNIMERSSHWKCFCLKTPHSHFHFCAVPPCMKARERHFYFNEDMLGFFNFYFIFLIIIIMSPYKWPCKGSRQVKLELGAISLGWLPCMTAQDFPLVVKTPHKETWLKLFATIAMHGIQILYLQFSHSFTDLLALG